MAGLCQSKCPQPSPPPGVDHKMLPRWKQYGPLVCGREPGHDGLHGGPYLYWHDPPIVEVRSDCRA